MATRTRRLISVKEHSRSNNPAATGWFTGTKNTGKNKLLAVMAILPWMASIFVGLVVIRLLFSFASISNAAVYSPPSESGYIYSPSTPHSPVQNTQTPRPTLTSVTKSAPQTSNPNSLMLPDAPLPTTSLSIYSPPMKAEEWKNWPVIPRVSENAIEIYRSGLRLGNNPQVFSILGDCQSIPDVFMGVYDQDPLLVEALAPELRETITNFSGSFSRSRRTVQDGTTIAAVLWSAWNRAQFNCDKNESPLDCELRQSQPSIVFINLGTHYETRNIIYLRKVLDILIEHGSLPILATKADNREQDEHVNQQMAELALEYDIPLWNFYAAVSSLPDHGVSVKAGREHQGEIYLVPEALEIHRFTALQVLDAVWRAVR